jgi:hypothetical protein
MFSRAAMERAARVLGNLKLNRQGVDDSQLVVSAWASAVGKRLSGRTNPVELVRARLVVEVEDAIWQRQLFGLRGQIMTNLRRILGREIVTEIEFRVAVPKRAPQRAESHASVVVPEDEANTIHDPVFRMLYKASRKRSTA